MCKVTETDCFDSNKFSKSHLALEKRNVKVKLCLRARTPRRALFWNYFTDTDFNATRL